MNREVPVRWKLIALLTLLLLIGSSASTLAQEGTQGAPTSTSGTLEIVHFDDFENSRSMETYWLVSETGQRTELRFADGPPAGLQTGAVLQATGEVADGALLVGELLDLSGEAAAAVTGEQRTVVLTLNWQDRTLSCSNSQVQDIMFTGARNTDGFYRETSYDSIWFTGIVRGAYTLNYPSTGACDYYAWAAAADAAAQADGIDLSPYNRKVYVLPSSGTCGSWIGLGTIGGNPSRSWIFSCATVDVYPHELGHNLTMHHSSTDPNNDGTIDVEYGDTSDIMGYGGVGWRQINAPHKEEMGWLPSSKYQAVTAAGTYSIAPTELAPTATSLPQALKIPRADGGYYYISYRQPIGYDASMRAEYANRATIHHWNGVSATQTMLITTLTDGGSWSDTAGALTVRQVSHSADAVTVEISFQCAERAPSVTLSPTSRTGKAGALATYSVSVVNNDGASCPSTAFNLTGSAPATWSASVSPGAITLSPGQSGSATLSVTSPAGAASGSYPVGVNASDGVLPIHNAGGSATYVVDSSPPSAPANLKASVKTKSVTLSWTASSDNIGVTGYEVYRNNGLLATAAGTTYKDTTVKRGTTYSYFVKARDAAGNVSGPSNTVTVTAK